MKPPDSKEIVEKILEGQHFVSRGRYYKGISIKDAHDNLEKSYDIFHKLLDELEPIELRGRIYAAILAVIAFLAGSAVTIIVAMIVK